MLISIIIPVYNAEKFLAATIQSALNQTYQNIEIILVDDGSTDKSCDIIDDFQIRYPEKIRTLTKRKNTGEAIARNEGISKSQGEWIYLLDSDDIMYPDAIERLTAGILETDSKIILGHRDRINIDGKIIQNDTSMRWKKGNIENFLTVLMEKNPFTPGNFLIQKNIIQKIDLATTIRYGEDWLLFIHLVLLSDIFCIGGHPIYSYRSHIYQQSKSPISFSERKKVIEAIYNIADLKKKYPIMRYHFLKTKAIIRLGLWHYGQHISYRFYLFLSR